MSYFVIERARKVGNKMQIQGDMIVGATYEVPVDGSSSVPSDKGDKPQIDFPSPPEIKWILPPRNEFGHNMVSPTMRRKGICARLTVMRLSNTTTSPTPRPDLWRLWCVPGTHPTFAGGDPRMMPP